MTPDRLEVRPAARGKFVWNFVAGNGKVTANNETFASRGNALRAVKAHVRNLAALFGLPVAFKTRRRGDVTAVYVISAAYPAVRSLQ